MITCSACNHDNPDSVAICESCGKPLEGAIDTTLKIKKGEVEQAAKSQRSWSSAQLDESRNVTIQISGTVWVQKLPGDNQEPLTMGRFDGGDAPEPDIDLTPYGASENGVSRLHAEMRVQGDMVQIKDRDSTNGTFLNGQRVSTTEWRIMRDGDELQLGSLTMKLLF